MKNAKSICILGRQPELGLAELESLYGSDAVTPINGAALLTIPAEEINFRKLGGTIKVGKILTTLPYTDWHKLSAYLKDNIPQHVKSLEPGKFTLGVSLYGLNVKTDDITKTLLGIKKTIKTSGRPVRVVQNKQAELSSAQVLHNKLIHKGAWELMFIKNGNEAILAQTLFVQDIESYAERDQMRPKRDARVGMLPPKLAQIIVNLAVGGTEQKLMRDARQDGTQGEDENRSESYKEYDERESESTTQRSAGNNSGVSGSAGKQTVASRIRVLDPFCGTGVLLQEAMLMGYHVIGTDIDPRMVEYSKENLAWLVSKYPRVETSANVQIADATNFVWPRFSAVACETYLGRPFSAWPAESDLRQVISDANTIIKKFLVNLSAQMQKGQKACVAVPAWKKPNGEILHLPLIDQLTDMGYNYLDLKHVPRSKLIYYREDQVVARQLIRIEKA